MPHQLTWEKKGVLSQYSGPFTEALHAEGLHKLFGDPRIDRIKYIIGDYSGVNGNLLTEEYIDYPVAITTGAARYLKELKVALVARDPDIIKLCHQFRELAKSINAHWKFQIFDDIESARKWVNSSL